MGASISSNVANAVATVANSVQNNTSATNTQISNCITTYNLDQCIFTGKFTANNLCDIKQTSSQIVSATQKNNVNNTIAQKLAQEAASTVGAFGLGFADANNTVNAFANSYNNIINSVTSSAQQNANTSFNFNCYGSTFDGDTVFNVTSEQNFLSDQVLNQQATNEVINNITQDIRQKATATVQGIAGLILVVLLILAALFFLLRPAISKGMMVLVFVIILIIIIVFVITAYTLRWPPFFNPPTQCIGTQASVGGCSNDYQCINISPQTVAINNPPLRYNYPIIGQGDQTVDPQNAFVPGMLQMDISLQGGWTDKAYNYFNENLVPLGVPNPLYHAGQDSSGNNIYRTNVNGDPNKQNDIGWQGYINVRDASGNDVNAGYARLVLAHDLGFDTYARIHPYEQCYLNGRLTSSGCYTFNPHTMPPNLQVAVNGGGTISGDFGVCNTPSYQIQKYTFNGLLIIGIIILILIIIFAWRLVKSNK